MVCQAHVSPARHTSSLFIIDTAATRCDAGRHHPVCPAGMTAARDINPLWHRMDSPAQAMLDGSCHPSPRDAGKAPVSVATMDEYAHAVPLPTPDEQDDDEILREEA